MEAYNPQEFRNTVLHAGYELYESQGHNYFGEYQIEQFLNQAGMQDIPSGRIEQACNYLLEDSMFRRTEVVWTYAITNSGIDQVEGERER